MKKLALIILSALLAASPARADFFDDVGDAFDKMGNSIARTAKDVGNSVDDAFTQKPDANKPNQQQTGNKPDIRWNNQPVTEFSGATVFSSSRNRNNQLNTARNPNMRDDAPAPHAAPHREPVEAAYIAPLPGFSEAPPRPAATYSPVMAAAALPAAEKLDIPLPSRVPTAKPAAVQNRFFAVRFNTQHVSINDRLAQSGGVLPGDDTKAIIDAAAKTLQANPRQRLKLHAEAIVEEDRVSEARKRSFDRALLVKGWLQEAGVRSTQIDLDVAGGGAVDAVTLSAYTPN